MQALLERQTKALESIQKDIKQDKIIQIAQLYEEKRLDDESEKTLETLKSLDKGIKKLNDNSGNNLNGNVIKLFKEIQKVSSPKRNLNAEEVKSITGASMERRQFNTLRPRVDSFKDNVKDFFTMRGFLDKTGIVSRGSGGIISEYLDRNEAKKKYADSRVKVDAPTIKADAGKLARAAGLTSKAGDWDKLSEEQKAPFIKQAQDARRKTALKQFDQQQKIQYDISKNEAKLKEYRDQGFTEDQINNTPEAKQRTKLAAELAKVDTRVRPSGFDVKTGEVKISAPETATEQQAKAKSAGKGKVIPFSGSAEAAGSSLGSEETMLEQNRMVAEQSELLKKIEENTRGLKGGTEGGGTTQKPAEEEAGGLGLMDMLGGKAGKLGKIAKMAGRGLLSGAKAAGSFMLRRAGPLAAVAAVGAGAYEGYKGWTEASDKQEAAKEEIKAKVESGEITQGEANQLTKQVDETATVEKGGAAGKGAGMAIGGAAGALKGAAVGAAIGSAVPVVGTVIGGAIGATVGAIGGSWLGGKGGKWLGEKFGQAKNWMFGKSGESDVKAETGSSVSIDFSEAQFAEKDPDNYKKFAAEREELAKKYAEEKANKVGRKEPSPIDRKVAYNKANLETIQKYRKEIEAAGAGKITGGKKDAPGDKTAEALKKTAEGVTPDNKMKVGGKEYTPAELDKAVESGAVDPAVANNARKVWSVKERAAGRDGSGITAMPAAAPSSGDTVSRASGENEAARLDATKGGGGNTVVSAPTINNNTQNQTSSVKLSPRNNDSTVNKYMQSRWAF